MSESIQVVPCPLRAAALSTPNAPAIVGPQGTVSYDELDRMVSAAAAWLEALEPGSLVALYLPKGERYVVLVLAVIRAGHVACPVSDRIPPQGVGQLLERAGCDALISEHEGVLRAVGPGVRVLRPQPLLEADRKRNEPTDIPLKRPATMIFTSGSTGIPKAALHTFGNHYHSALGSNANIALRPGDRWLLSLPLYHVGGLSVLFRCLLAGATIALPEHEASLGESIADLDATHVSLVSTQLLRLLCENTELGGLKAVLMGGGPVAASLVEEAVARGLPIYTSYGLTEMASQVTTTPPDASIEELRTSGRVLPYREVSVSERGEILVRGETLFAGYVVGESLNLPLDGEGWFHTGDLGELDGSGYLRILGREDNLFISGGENVQPEEIERVLSALPGVEAAVVVPVDDPEFGQRPVAFVSMENRSSEYLASELEKVLPRFKLPIAFYPWPEESGGMKVDRASFRERARILDPKGRS